MRHHAMALARRSIVCRTSCLLQQSAATPSFTLMAVRCNSSAGPGQGATRAQFNTPSPTPGKSIAQAAASAAADPEVRSKVLDAASKLASSKDAGSGTSATGPIEPLPPSTAPQQSSSTSFTASDATGQSATGPIEPLPPSTAPQQSPSTSFTASDAAGQSATGPIQPLPPSSAPQQSASPSFTQQQSPPPPPPPPSAPLKKRKRGFFRRLRLIVGFGTLALVASGAYYAYEASHPPEQLPFDASKKTVVVLGSGWGATALLDGLDTADFNVVIISPFNYFLFTPLLPSVTVGTLNGRSILQPTRYLARYKKREVQVLEAEATKVDVKNKTVTFEDRSAIVGGKSTSQISYDYLVYAVGSQNQTFGIEGVTKHGLFLKELADAEAIRRRLMDCVEKASMLGQSEEEIDRLLHFVVVGGGPTGVEASGEFRDFVRDDLSKWYPAVSGRVKVTLIEALPNILPSFSKNLVEFTEHVFKENEIQILTKHVVKDVDEKSVTVAHNGKTITIPCGMLVWAAGNTARPITRDMQAQMPESQTNRRGLLVDEHLRLKGAEESVFAIGDATATECPPTAQVANQQGKYLASVLEGYARLERIQAKLHKTRLLEPSPQQESELRRLEKKLQRTQAGLKPFHYTNRGAMAYIGTEKAILDLPYGSHGSQQFSSGGLLTSLAWSSAYWSMLFGVRSRASVMLDWIHVRCFGRPIEASL